MKKINRLKKATLYLSATLLVLFLFLIGLVLTPSLMYANKTVVGNYTVYHQQPLDQQVIYRMQQADVHLRQSEWYDPALKLDICINDGSLYPALMEKLRGPAFGWGFANKMVLMAKADFTNNTAALRGYSWNLTQLIAHEATHCIQFHHLGLFNSNPVARYPGWKWEGYSEYISRQDNEQKDLHENITRWLNAEKTQPGEWAVYFNDNTIAPKNYYQAWLMVKYCLDIRQLNYQQLLSDKTPETVIEKEMMDWYFKTSASSVNNKTETPQ